VFYFFHDSLNGAPGRQSGLTGSPDIPDPPPKRPEGLRGRLATVRQAVGGTMAALPRVLGLVWEASPALTLGLATATALAGIVPAANAYTGKLLINAVVQAIQVRAIPPCPTRLSCRRRCRCSAAWPRSSPWP